jgi:8-oxo-dGTP pyrophosphatase MutT (NUDIX family)
MNTFDIFIESLKNRFKEPLPGKEAQFLMASPRRKQSMPVFPEQINPKPSSVLILLYPEKNDICTILIKRPDYEGVHSGQISFPGGKKEDNDLNLVETAVRESREEVGIDPASIEILGMLTELFIPPSNFIVQPVVAFTRSKPRFTADPVEVDSILEIKLSEFLRPENQQDRTVQVRGWELEVPCWYIQGQVIWGATAMILSEFLQIIPALN